jgi:CzcA family heavy metal efflux pump
VPTPALYHYPYYVRRPALARGPGAGRIDVLASDTREIEVVLDPARLAAAHLTTLDVADALRSQNTLAPIGRFADAGQQRLALASGQWTDLAQIAAAPVGPRPDTLIRVGDLGAVVPGSPDRTLLVTGNGRDAVSISISQQPGADVLAVQAGVDHTLQQLTHTLPAGLHIARVYDLAEFVTSAVANVRDAILLGGALAVLVLLLFLRDLRLTAIAALTLPLAVMPAFFVMHVMGQSINLMSMGGLAVAIGLVIDDAVVVVEGIHRRVQSGDGDVGAAVSELIAPLVSSTLTTVVVFAPLALLSGVVGQFFRALSITLSSAVLMSLALSVTVVPVLARRIGPSRPGPDRARWAEAYRTRVAAIVRHPRVAFAAAIVLALFTVAIAFAVPTGFLPHADEGGFVIDYRTPPGSSLEDTDGIVRQMERVLRGTPEVLSYSRRTGSELGLFATALNEGDILVRLKPRGQRSRSADEVIADLRDALAKAAPRADIEFVQLLQDMLGDLEGNPEPIEVKVFGDDPTVLADAAAQIDGIIGRVRGVVDVVSPQRGSPEQTWRIDPAAAARVGLTEDRIAAQVSAAWLGTSGGELRLLDRRIPLRVRQPDAVRFDPAAHAHTQLRTAGNAFVPLSSVAQPSDDNGQAELVRENLRQMAPVTARLEDRALGDAVSEIEMRLAGLRLPVGYGMEVGGQYASQQAAFREMLAVFGVAVVLVLLVLLLQFRSLTPALLVLSAAPLSLGGALLLLVITGTELNVSSAMGLILLVGLVVKNGIMLLEMTERRRDGGQSAAEAVSHAAAIRLRPILMTTLCTLFGLLPLAFGIGAGAELQRSLALAVIGGLAVSTAVTLLVVPGLYVAFAGGVRAGLKPGPSG